MLLQNACSYLSPLFPSSSFLYWVNEVMRRELLTRRTTSTHLTVSASWGRRGLLLGTAAPSGPVRGHCFSHSALCPSLWRFPCPVNTTGTFSSPGFLCQLPQRPLVLVCGTVSGSIECPCFLQFSSSIPASGSNQAFAPAAPRTKLLMTHAQLVQHANLCAHLL